MEELKRPSVTKEYIAAAILNAWLGAILLGPLSALSCWLMIASVPSLSRGELSLVLGRRDMFCDVAFGTRC